MSSLKTNNIHRFKRMPIPKYTGHCYSLCKREIMYSADILPDGPGGPGGPWGPWLKVTPLVPVPENS